METTLLLLWTLAACEKSPDGGDGDDTQGDDTADTSDTQDTGQPGPDIGTEQFGFVYGNKVEGEVYGVILTDAPDACTSFTTSLAARLEAYEIWEKGGFDDSEFAAALTAADAGLPASYWDLELRFAEADRAAVAEGNQYSADPAGSHPIDVALCERSPVDWDAVVTAGSRDGTEGCWRGDQGGLAVEYFMTRTELEMSGAVSAVLDGEATQLAINFDVVFCDSFGQAWDYAYAAVGWDLTRI